MINYLVYLLYHMNKRLHLIGSRYVNQRQHHGERSDRIRDDHHDGARHVSHDHLPVVRLGLLAPGLLAQQRPHEQGKQQPELSASEKQNKRG